MLNTSGVLIVSRLLLLTSFMLLTTSAGNLSDVSMDSGKDDTWELLENAEGVKIFYRWVDVSDNVRVRERKAEILVHSSMEKSLKMITDVQLINTWMSGIKKSMILHRDNAEKWYTYMLYGLPWPFNDREIITLNTLTYSAKRDKVFLRMQSSDEGYPPARGVERLTHYKASWELFEVKPGLTRMIFIARSEDPPAFPRCVQDPVIKKVFYRNMLSLKELLTPQ